MVLLGHRDKGRSVGFVPTMGALHEGHLSLVKNAKHENEVCVCSVFVNPTQFNDPNDLLKYPRQIERDIELLESVNCDYLFFPEEDEMYPEGEEQIQFDFGSLEKVMEGQNRPGHFQGVGIIVKKLLEIVRPDRAYFGKKDYQQLLIIKSLNAQYNLGVDIIGCEIIREDDGLAMSSRNQRLSKEQRLAAPQIYAVLKAAREQSKDKSVEELKSWVAEQINACELMELVYFEVSNAESLEELAFWSRNQRAMGFIVVRMGEVRLIDNVELR